MNFVFVLVKQVVLFWIFIYTILYKAFDSTIIIFLFAAAFISFCTHTGQG